MPKSGLDGDYYNRKQKKSEETGQVCNRHIIPDVLTRLSKLSLPFWVPPLEHLTSKAGVDRLS